MLNGTVVTVTCGSRLNDRASDSAVWSWRMRRQRPPYWRSGSTTHTSDLPSATTCAAAVIAARGRRRSGHSTSSSSMSPRPPLAPLLRELVGAVLVEHEVHRPQLVGMQRPPEVHRARRREVDAVDEHEHDEAAADGRVRGAGHVDLQCSRFRLVLLGEPDQEEHQDRDEHDDQPRAAGELREPR